MTSPSALREAELVTHFMAARKKRLPKEPLVVRSCTLTPSLDKTVKQVAQEASDALGWTISTSAAVRSILRYVEQQPASWALSYIFPLIEKELSTGVIWGSKKK